MDDDGISFKGDQFYKEYDFQGWYLDAGVGNQGSGIMWGRMRGYGYVEFSTELDVKMDASINFGTYGPMTGKYLGDQLLPSLNNPQGLLSSFLGQGLTNALTGEWHSMDLQSGKTQWIGESPGIGISFSIFNSPDTYFSSTTSILKEFTNSTKQKSTYSLKYSIRK